MLDMLNKWDCERMAIDKFLRSRLTFDLSAKIASNFGQYIIWYYIDIGYGNLFEMSKI